MSEKKKTVLLVDDDLDVLESLRRLVEIGIPGLRYLSASSAKEGLALMAENHVDVVVSDFRMPEVDGIRFLEEVKKRDPGVTTLMLTAYPSPEVAREAFKRGGVILLVSKPFDPASFVKVLGAVARGD